MYALAAAASSLTIGETVIIGMLIYVVVKLARRQ